MRGLIKKSKQMNQLTILIMETELKEIIKLIKYEFIKLQQKELALKAEGGGLLDDFEF